MACLAWFFLRDRLDIKNKNIRQYYQIPFLTSDRFTSFAMTNSLL